jgi:hypothetical protein
MVGTEPITIIDNVTPPATHAPTKAIDRQWTTR